jgi:hypothetical protein
LGPAAITTPSVPERTIDDRIVVDLVVIRREIGLDPDMGAIGHEVMVDQEIGRVVI